MAAARNLTLDGWRAIGVVGVMWLHWAPREWRGAFPFEMGLYFFLVLTGFFVTRLCLRDRDERKPGAYRSFIKRRGLRILVPCLVAMAVGWIAGAPDLRAHPGWYLSQLSNFHIARSLEWPSGTSHYWSLAIQSQFYLLWPLLVLFLPRRALGPVFVGIVLTAPLSRYLLATFMPELPHRGAVTSCAFDYLGTGALLALGMHAGMKPGDHRLRRAALVSALFYAVLYVMEESGRPVPGLRHFQQTFLSVALAGLIAKSLSGLPRRLAGLLEHRAVQHVARLSYALYLLHTIVPILLGHLLPFLWMLPDHGPGLALRLVVFFLASWGGAWLLWRFVEQPMERIRGRIMA